MSLSRRLKHRWHSLTGKNAARQRAAQDQFVLACGELGPGQLAIDLGANAGLFTAKLAETGADVIAFEPDPYAVELLTQRIGKAPNVTIYAKAAGDKAGELMLHRTANFAQDPQRHTTSSSLLADKKNVRGGEKILIEVVDFVSFLETLDRDVAILKIDIEGAEVELMEALLESDVCKRIQYVFVETHERAIPRLADRTDALRARTNGTTRPVVNWDWH